MLIHKYRKFEMTSFHAHEIELNLLRLEHLLTSPLHTIKNLADKQNPPRSNHLALIFILDVSSPMVLRPMVPGLVNDPIRVLSKQFVAEAALPLLLPEVHHFDVSAECRTATQDLAACFAKVVNFVSPLWPWDRGTLYLEGNGARDNLAHGRGNFNFSGRHVYIS